MAAHPSRNMLIADEGEFARIVAWTPPFDDSWKLSFAGHYKGASNAASVGCIVRDHNGAFKAGFALPLGKVSSFTIAQLTAFKRALDFAISEGVETLQIEGDQFFVFRMIQGEIRRSGSEVGELVNKCISDLRHIRSVRLRPVRMYDNLAANLLARMALDREQSCFWFDDPPPKEIAEILARDVTGRWMPLSYL